MSHHEVTQNNKVGEFANSKREKGTLPESIQGYRLQLLDRATVKKNIATIATLASGIPQVAYTEEEILTEEKAGKKRVGKWDHSLVLFDKEKPIAMVIGCEREGEGNEQYPTSTLYISELAVDPGYRKKGIAKELLKVFFDYNTAKGFQHLEGEFNYSLQTNAAPWNQHIQDLYRSFGFQQRAKKQYDNRTDVILGMKPQ